MSFRKLKSLFFKSAKIQEEIEREQKRPAPDTFRLLRLKKIRLSIKDQILKMTTKSRKGWKKGKLQPQMA